MWICFWKKKWKKKTTFFWVWNVWPQGQFDRFHSNVSKHRHQAIFQYLLKLIWPFCVWARHCWMLWCVVVLHTIYRISFIICRDAMTIAKCLFLNKQILLQRESVPYVSGHLWGLKNNFCCCRACARKNSINLLRSVCGSR